MKKNICINTSYEIKLLKTQKLVCLLFRHLFSFGVCNNNNNNNNEKKNFLVFNFFFQIYISSTLSFFMIPVKNFSANETKKKSG